MPRYIDADALVKRLKHSPLFLGTNTQFKDGVIDLVERQPTADVVEVVRCKDCEHYKPQPKYKNSETKYCCRSAYVRVNADDYCSYGKRKEDE